MRIGGHGLREHVSLLAPLFGLLGAVWLIRIILGAAGAPSVVIRIASLTVVGPASALLAAVLIHSRQFGSYANVVLSSFLLNGWVQLLIITAIAFGTISGIENVYTAPEFSMPFDDPYHIRHILGHITVGLGIGSLIGAAEGCLLLWLLRRITPGREPLTPYR